MERITLERTAGWRMPPNTRVVTRSTIFGNPFTVQDAIDIAGIPKDKAQHYVVDCFRRWMNGSDRDWTGPESDKARITILSRLPELRGKNLACVCKPGTPCHADVLMELANA